MHASPKTGAILTALFLVGCEPAGPTIPDPVGTAASASDSAPITADRNEYVLVADQGGWEGSLRFEYTNRTGRTISIVNCNGGFALRLDQWQEEEWVNAWSPTIAMCLSQPIEIAPGATYAWTVNLFGGYPDGNAYPRFDVDRIDGTYRLVVESAYWSYDHDGPPWGERLPPEERVSHTFEIWTD